MKLSEIKVIEKEDTKQVFIDGTKQDFVVKVETEVLPGENTVVKISYLTRKFEIIRED